MEKILDALSIEELADKPRRTAVIKALEKGDLASVNFEKKGEEVSVWLAANAQAHQLDCFDEKMQRIELNTENNKEERQTYKRRSRNVG